jgi:hypothetical protein
MRTANLVAIAVLTAEAALAGGKSVARINVCIEHSIDGNILSHGEINAYAILGRAGIQLEFHNLKSGFCASRPDRTVVVNVSESTPETLEPGALAHSLPYEGVHIQVFFDRIRAQVRVDPGVLMGYVLVHEITHILQGVARHSDSGIMKARWDSTEYCAINLRALFLTKEDIRLIGDGVSGWSQRTVLWARSEVQPHPVLLTLVSVDAVLPNAQ